VTRKVTGRCPAPETADTDAAKSDAQAIDDIASELNRLVDRRINPEMFLERRDDLVRRLRRIAKRLGAPKKRDPEVVELTTWHPGGAEPQPRMGGKPRMRTIFVKRL
jgi:hypothetical protein